MSKREKRELARKMIQGWSLLAYPDAKDIPEDPEEGARMQARADREAACVLEFIVQNGLV